MSAAGAGRRSPLPAIAACMFLSGLASLSLEVVWSRSLELVFGSSALAITTILVAYMGGLGIGGLLGGRLARRLRDGVRAYGWMEIAIGLYALAVPWALAGFPALDGALAGLGFWPAALLRFGAVLVLLAPPTLLMGATLPVLIEALVRSPAQLASRAGLLYGANTLGAVAGVLGATFLAFPRLGVRGTNTAAALLDLAVGLLALWLARAGAVAPAPARLERAPGERARWPLLVSYGLVGFTALAYEVSWTRALTLILGSSVYAFATMLAGFLLGIALGSLLARRLAERARDRERLYVLGLFALSAAALAVVFFLRALPAAFLGAFATVGISGASLVWLGLLTSFVVMLAPTMVLGALFPLVVRLVDGGRGQGGSAVGAVYFANTLGSAAGAFCAGFLVIPRLGLRATFAGAIALDLLAAALVAAAGLRAARASGSAGARERWRPLAVGAGLLGSAAVLALAPDWRERDFALGVYYRSSAQLDFGLPPVEPPGAARDELLFYAEGLNCTVAVQRSAAGLEEGLLSLRINGKTDASLADMSTQVLSGHLPLLFGGPAREALVIGYASGVTAGALTLHQPERLDVCELEPAVVAAAALFDDYNHRPLEQPGVHLIVEDGRAVVSRAARSGRGRWDVIVSEPSNPWMTGCSNLFTREFFAAADRALKPGGRLLQWIQLYGMDRDGLTSVLAAVFESFDHVYGFLADTGSADLLLLASDEPLRIASLPDWDDLSPQVRRDLERVRVHSRADLWSLLALLPADLRLLAASAPRVNTDDNLFVELRSPWYLYDETPETAELLHARARGIVPLAAEQGFAWPPGLLGELTLSYLDRRLDDRLAAIGLEALVDAGDAAYRALVEAEFAIVEERADRKTLALLDGAVRLAPRAFAPRFHRAWLLNRIDRFEPALADLDVALQLRPEHLEARRERLRALAGAGRMRAAYDEAAFLIETPLVESEPRLFAEAAFLAGGFGRFEQAIPLMCRYLELEPLAPDDWELLAHWYQLSGRADEAAAALASAGRARAGQVRDLHWLARWHERYGTSAEARLALDAVLALDPDNAAAQADRARLAGP